MPRLTRPSIQSASPYDGLATGYDRVRPDYPPDALALLSAQAGDLVADVGAGTGIFSRQLAQSLRDACVVGVEPGSDMLRAAEDASHGLRNLSFVAGAAEALPFPDASLALVTAATAAHWFDRPVFYAEASRCLREGRMLAIFQNMRRWWDSPFLAAYEELHEQTVPGYRRGTFPACAVGYAAIDVAGELRRQGELADVCEHAFPWQTSMDGTAFAALSLSSSITRTAADLIGEAAFLARLEPILERWSDASGRVDVPYLTTAVTAAKQSLPAGRTVPVAGRP
jgi:SAM-dependent methyltransferase